MPYIVLAAGIAVVALIGLIGLIVVYKMAKNRIDLTYVVSEMDGSASLSRFQFLIFTFVIAMCFMVLSLDSGQFPKVDASVLGLLGISGGSYVVAKSIQSKMDKDTQDADANARAAKAKEAKDKREDGQ